MKRALCLLLSVFMAAGLLTGCSPTDPAGPTGGDNNFEPYEGAPNLSGVTVTILSENTWVSGVNFSSILPRFKQIEERTGCTIVWETVAGGTDYNTLVQTRLAGDASDCPDIIMLQTEPGTLSGYIDQSLLYDITKAYDVCPNIKKFYEEYRTDLKSSFTYFDGGIYNVVSDTWYNRDEQVEYYGTYGDNALWYRADIAEELGWTTYPKTIDELYQLLKAVKEKYPNMVPLHMWDWCNWESAKVFNSAYGLHYNNEEANSFFYPDENGVVQYEPVLNATKEWLTEMNKWYKEGLIVIGASQEAKIGSAAQGKTFAGFYNGIYETVQPILKESEPNAQFAYMPMPSKDGYKTTYMPRADYNYSFSIVDNGNEAQCRAAAQFLDYAYFSDYGIYSERAGVEGEGWSLDESGNFVPSEAFIAKLLKNELTLEATGAHVHFCGPSIQRLEVEKIWMSAQDKVRADLGLPALMTEAEKANWLETSTVNASHYCPAFPNMYITREDRDAIGSIGSDIATFTAEYLERYIIGTKKLDNFQSEFVDKLYGMGLQDLLDIYQRYYDNWLANADR